MRARTNIIIISLCLCVTATAARADDGKALAKQHFASGEAKFKAGDYRGAIADFQAADALVPSPILSYNIGLCHEKLGEPEAAVQSYRDYLRRRPDAPNRTQVEGRIARIEGEIAAAKKPAPKPEPEPEPDPQRTPDLDDDQPGIGDGKPGGKIGPGWVDKDAKDPAVPPPDDPGAEPQPDPGAGAGGGSDPALSKRLADRRSNATPDVGSGVAVGADAGRPRGGGTPPAQEGNKKAKPAYKEWWFWVVVGVSAVILISFISDDGSPSGMPMGREAPGGAVLFTF